MKTVIILGAGSSSPFGFPLGPDLSNLIREKMRTEVVHNRLLSQNYSKETVLAFAEVLQYSTFATIDELLEAKKYLRQIGGYMIAESILEIEMHNSIFPKKDWHVELFRILLNGFRNNTEYDISFVTLNYDRSLEHFFSKVAFYECHDHEEKAFANYLASIPIVHAHGSLGSLDEHAYGVADGTSLSPDAVQKAGHRIQIVSDNLRDSPNYFESTKLIHVAEQIVFLGCAYHPSTLEGLFSGINLDNVKLSGTSHGLNDHRAKSLKNWSRDTFKLHPTSAADFLRSKLALS